MAEFGAFATQELAPGRHVVEQIADFHRAARRMGGWRRIIKLLAAIAGDAPAGFLSGWPGSQRQAGNSRNARQRLAAKAETGDLLQIVETGDFAGGVAGQGQGQFAGGNPAAVVANPDQPDAALLHLNGDPGRAGIQTVFQQLLDDRSGTFNHLAGRNLTDQLRRQPLNGLVQSI